MTDWARFSNPLRASNAGRSTLDRAVAHYGLTESWSQAGFILPDGSMLDFSEGGGGGRTMDHHNVEQFVKTTEHESRHDALVKFMRITGAIRFGPEGLTFMLVQRPTGEQITRMLEIVRESGKPPILEIRDARGDVAWQRQYDPWNQREFARDLRKAGR